MTNAACTIDLDFLEKTLTDWKRERKSWYK